MDGTSSGPAQAVGEIAPDDDLELLRAVFSSAFDALVAIDAGGVTFLGPAQGLLAPEGPVIGAEFVEPPPQR